MNKHIENTRGYLGALGSLAERTRRTEQRILEMAEKRLEDVQVDIDRAAPGIESASESAQDRYAGLLSERGDLNLIIARARAALG